MRSSNFTNLWPCRSGTSRATAAGKSCIGTSGGSASATAGGGACATGASGMHHAVVDAAALLVAQREFTRRGLAAGGAGAARRLVHGPCVLFAKPAMASRCCCEGDARNKRDHHHTVRLGPRSTPHV